MKEIWRPVVGFEGLYEVSNFGRVKSLNYNHTGQEQILKPRRNRVGYLEVVLYKNGKEKTLKVHRLVGMAFPDLVDWTEDAKGRPFSELDINHRDQNKENNHVENLEWCDHGYNMRYGTAIERMTKAKSKPVYQRTLDDEFVREWPSAKEVERQTGWHQSAISACCRGERKSAYGFIWSTSKLYRFRSPSNRLRNR